VLPSFLASIAAIFPVLGLGTILRHGGDPALRPCFAGFIGAGIAATLGTVLNFWVPITPWVAALVVAAGVALLAARWRWLFEAFAARDAIAPVLVVAAATIAMRPPAFHYDSGLYHLQAIRWMTEQPLFLGLANVHHRLGFNSLWLMTGAILETPLTAGKSMFFLNQLPVAFGASASIVGLKRLVDGDRSFSNLLLAATAAPVASATFAVGGLYVDFTAAVVAYLAIVLWARALEAQEFAREAVPAAALSLLAALLKITTGVVPAAGLALLLARRASVPRRTWAALAAMASIALVPWLVRNALATGCLIFPVTGTCFQGLPWTVPLQKTAAAAEHVREWARAPGHAAAGPGWLTEWVGRVLRDYPELVALACAFAAGAAALAWGRPRPTAAFRWVMVTATAGMAFWFVSAPDPRFGLGPLYALGLAPALFAASAAEGVRARRGVRVAVALALVLPPLALAAALVGRDRTGWTMGLPSIERPIWSWPAIPRVPQVEVVSDGGVRLLLPAVADRCWAGSIPCTPPDELERGLRFDGYFHVERPRAGGRPASGR
jgi:hypothetical protein